MPSTRHTRRSSPVAPSAPDSDCDIRAYVGEHPASLQHGPTRGMKRKASTMLEDRCFVGRRPPPSFRAPEEGPSSVAAYVGKRLPHALGERKEKQARGGRRVLQSRTASYAGSRLPHSRAVQSADEEDETFEGPAYVGKRVHRAPPDRFQKRGLVTSVSDDEEDEDEDEAQETTNDSSTFVDQPAGPPDSRTSISPEVDNVYYVPEDDEEDEDDDLIVRGETALEDSRTDSEDIPIRALKDFTIYERSSNSTLVHFSPKLLSDKTRSFGASGCVEPYVEDDSSDEASESGDQPPQRIRLSDIKEIKVHCVRDQASFELDPNIYIRTAYAWYVLHTPSPQYAPFWTEFSIKERIFFELITTVVDDRSLKYEELEKHIQEQDDADRPMTAEDLRDESVREYIRDAWSELQRECIQGHSVICIRLSKAPAVQELVTPPRGRSPSVPLPLSGSTTREPSADSAREPSPSREKSYTPKAAPEPTVVTPRVHALCQDLFPLNEFEVVGTDRQERAVLTKAERRRHAVHEHDPERIEWVRSSQTVPHHYKAVLIDGVRYDVGDTVMVEPGEDDNKARVQFAKIESSNPMAKSKWFAKICYMYEEPNTNGYQMAHVQYYSHGAEIILKGMAHPYGLFLVDECMDIHLDSIYGKVNVRTLDPAEDEPLIEEEDNLYFTGVCWDANNAVFFDRTGEEEERARKRCKRGRPCVSCGVSLLQDDDDDWSIRDGALVHDGVTYHVKDFVYIRPELRQTDVYLIAQIMGIEESANLKHVYHSVNLRVYQRCDLVLRAETKAEFGQCEMDERRLFRSDTMVDDIDVRYIEGKAFVVHRAALSAAELEEWCAHDDHFFVDSMAAGDKPRSSDELQPLSRKSFRTCTECVELRKEHLAARQELRDTHEPLRGLELFAGAGGLSTGFDEGGFVKTMWAVELGASACLTYEANHPYAQVYHGSVNTVLKHAIETYEGQEPEPLWSEELERELPPMPKPGDVDFIYGGPPCQGFSRMNHSKTVDDYRNTLVCNMLSYVDFYRPKFFMLENVEGILFHPLNATQSEPGRKMKGGVRMGVVKLILRTLTSIGYQAHFKLLQAGQYGAPQSRLRVIFIGAQRGLPLPRFPIPTHCTADDVQQIKLETGNLLRPAVRVIPFEDKDIMNRKAWLQFAPHLRVSVEDAISDLPRFDWINPALEYEEDSPHEIRHRKAQGIRRFPAVNAPGEYYSGFEQPEPYAAEPLSRYQKWMRRDVEPDEGIAYQYTKRYAAWIVERVANIPFKTNANHTDLPEVLRNKVWFEKSIHGKSKPEYTTIYGRVDGKWHFQTTLTSAAPNAKGGRMLHPTQKRVLTVREFARAQGFPDHYRFLSMEDNAFEAQQKQVGNAVPVPLALALGKSVGAVLTSMWAHEDNGGGREESPEVPMFID